MQAWSFRSFGAQMCWVVGLAAAIARGGEPAPGEVPPHPLVTATETLYQRKLPQACDELLKLASAAPGLTTGDLVRLQLVTAMRGLDEGDGKLVARSISSALQLDRSAVAPPFAPDRLRTALEDARRKLPRENQGPPASRESRLEEARKAARAREPALRTLLRAVDTLYTAVQIDGATAVLDLARSSTPLTAADRAQIAVRLGTLKMDAFEEVEARNAFRMALEEDPAAVLPEYAPLRTVRIFEEIRLAHPPKPRSVTSGLPGPQKPLDDSKRWGLIAGGAGLAFVIAGAVAGGVALHAYQEERSASAGGDYGAYVANRDAAKAAITVSTCLYGAGAAGLGLGAFFFFRPPGQTAAGAGAGGQASLVIGGHF